MCAHLFFTPKSCTTIFKTLTLSRNIYKQNLSRMYAVGLPFFLLSLFISSTVWSKIYLTLSRKNFVCKILLVEIFKTMLTLKQRILLIQRYFQLNSYVKFQNEFANTFPDAVVPNESSILHQVNKFLKTDSVDNLKHNWCRSVLTTDKVKDISTAFQKEPSTSHQKVAARVNITPSSTYRVTKLLGLQPYHVNLVQELLQVDCPKLIEFCKCILKFQRNVKDFDTFFFSNKAWFILHEYVNFQNYRVWFSSYPHAYQQKIGF